jgi:hypothetical protein
MDKSRPPEPLATLSEDHQPDELSLIDKRYVGGLPEDEFDRLLESARAAHEAEVRVSRQEPQAKPPLAPPESLPPQSPDRP